MRLSPLAALLLLGACAHPDVRPPEFVDAATVIPGLVVEMRYAGPHNFVGRPIDGYERPICLLTRRAAEALAKVQQDIHGQALGLKVWDCYRPARAVAHFGRWARDLTDQSTKAEFYPNVNKADLFRLGYIAARSGHSRGSTVDLTLVQLTTGGPPGELDMGTPHDLFSPRSWPSAAGVGEDARANRARLAAAMARRGFAPLEQEWWHFTLKDEPYPAAYFDFPVR